MKHYTLFGKEVQAIFSDIDGTLIDSSSRLRERTIQAVKRLDLPFFLVSGRNRRGMEPFRQMLETKEPLLTVNGNMIQDADHLIYRGNTIPFSTLQKIVDPLIKDYGDEISIEIYDDEKWYCNTDNNPFVQYEIGVLKFRPDVLFTQADTLSEVKASKLLIIAPESICSLLYQKLHGTSRLQVVLNHPTYLEIYAEGTDKGTGVKKAMELYHIDPAKAIGFGDSGVDVSLLKAVGIPIAMKNGDECVKKVSLYETESNDEDGVAKILERIVEL